MAMKLTRRYRAGSQALVHVQTVQDDRTPDGSPGSTAEVGSVGRQAPNTVFKIIPH